MRTLIMTVLLLVAIGCTEAPKPELARPIELRALSPTGEPVSGLRAWLSGALLGETASDGVLRATLRGQANQPITLSWACPVSHEPPTGQRDLVLTPQAAGTRAPALKLEARCSPLDIEAALVVRASGAPASGLPIVVRDEVIARTDAEGFAHVLVRARRGSALTVGLDTREHPALVPASPLETFQLGDADTILLLDRALTVPVVKTKPARSSRAKKAEHRVPIRIQ